MKIAPVRDTRFAMVGEDGICLDLNSDTYYCLGDLSAYIDSLKSGVITASEQAAAMLIGTGLFREGVDTSDSRPIEPRASTLDDKRARAHSIDRWHFVIAAAHATIRGRGRPIRRLVGPKSKCRPYSIDDECAVRRRAVLFQRWLPWVPWQGRCLYRAFMLRSFLRLAGLDAVWVFGVRTWPFEAHCWLQFGPILLDDDVDRVSVYTPIWVA